MYRLTYILGGARGRGGTYKVFGVGVGVAAGATVVFGGTAGVAPPPVTVMVGGLTMMFGVIVICGLIAICGAIVTTFGVVRTGAVPAVHLSSNGVVVWA